MKPYQEAGRTAAEPLKVRLLTKVTVSCKMTTAVAQTAGHATETAWQTTAQRASDKHLHTVLEMMMVGGKVLLSEPS